MGTYRLWSNYLRVDRFMNSDDKKQKFAKFCQEKGVIYLSEIDDNLLMEYSELPGIGPGRIANIKKEMQEIYEALEEQKTYENIMNCKLDRIVYRVKNIENLTIGDFLKFKEKDLKERGYSTKELERIYERITTTLPLKEILKKIEINLGEDGIYLLRERLENGKTLEEIGNIKGISRERTRQIEIKYKQIVTNIFINTNLNVSLRIESDFKDEISLEQMEGLFGERYKFLVNFLKKNEIFARPYFIDFLDLFLFDRRERFFKVFYSLEFTNILTTKNVNTIRESFKNFKWITQVEIDKIITKLGYEKHGKYYIQHSGYKDILELYFVKLVKEPLRIDETTILNIVLDINSRLDYNLYSKDIEKDLTEETASYMARRLEGLLSRIDGIIMTDSRTYIHVSRIKYDLDKFIDLKDEVLKINDKYVDSISVYKALETKLKEIGIYSDYVFYSLFKYHFAQELTLNTNGNSRVLTIGEQEFNRVEELERFIEKQNKVLEKSYIQEKLNYSNVSLNNAIDNSKNILTFDRSYIGLIDFVDIKLDEVKLFKDLVESIEENGVLSVPDLISKIRLNKKFRRFRKNNKINKYFIAALVRHFCQEYKGGCNLLSKK